jgi:hypothetical protein
MLMQRPLDGPTAGRASNEIFQVSLMISHLTEALAGVFLIATVSLLAGLLRSAKASSQVTLRSSKMGPIGGTRKGCNRPRAWGRY